MNASARLLSLQSFLEFTIAAEATFFAASVTISGVGPRRGVGHWPIARILI
jgi:hypothetical protein